MNFNDELEFKTPEGKVKTQKVYFLRNALLEDVKMGTNGEVVFIPHMSALSVRTAVYKNHETDWDSSIFEGNFFYEFVGSK